MRYLAILVLILLQSSYAGAQSARDREGTTTAENWDRQQRRSRGHVEGATRNS